METTVCILGTQYKIKLVEPKEDKMLSECDGYTDWTDSKIVISDRRNDCEIKDFNRYLRKVVRHELVHAFLFESGLGENFKHVDYGHEETMVDWIAFQLPKIESCANHIIREFKIND